MSEADVAPPRVEVDLFSDASLRNPFADYRRMRDAGAVVKLDRPDVFAIGRFDDVQAALRNSDLLISGEGVGFSEAFNAPRGLNVIQSDGDMHRKLRLAVMRPLSPGALRGARDDLKAMIVARVAALQGTGWFEGMKSLAAFLPVEAISHLVGLPDVGRDRMLEWAAAAFNVIGPDQAEKDLKLLGEARTFMMGLTPEVLREGSWSGQLFAAAASGQLTVPEAIAAMSAYIIPSLDTTILAKGHLLYLLARDPEQWETLRARPDLIPSAVLEGVRHSSVIRWFSRVASGDYEVGGQMIPEGQRVMLLYGSANRDERRYENPDRFDVTRDARDQLAWGTGAHMCAGMHLARLEMEVLLEALVVAGARLSVGTPRLGANRGLYGFEDLPLRID